MCRDHCTFCQCTSHLLVTLSTCSDALCVNTDLNLQSACTLSCHFPRCSSSKRLVWRRQFEHFVDVAEVLVASTCFCEAGTCPVSPSDSHALSGFTVTLGHLGVTAVAMHEFSKAMLYASLQSHSQCLLVALGPGGGGLGGGGMSTRDYHSGVSGTASHLEAHRNKACQVFATKMAPSWCKGRTENPAW